MKKHLLFLIKFVFVFFSVLIIFDIFLSFLFEKEFYNSLGKGGENIDSHGDITKDFYKEYPDDGLEGSYKISVGKEKEVGSLLWLPKERRWNGYGSGECNIYGLGDSISYGMGVEAGEEYSSELSKLYLNTKVYNYGVVGHGVYQTHIMNKKYVEAKEKNLVIWQFFGDDFKNYKYMFGRIYNTSLNIDYLDGLPILSKYLGNDFNNFLLQRSYLYNKLLIIKIKSTKKEQSNETYLLNLIDAFLKNKSLKREKVLFIFGLNYNIDIEINKGELREDYKLVIDVLDKYDIPYINLTDYAEKDMFLWDNVHFSKKGHKSVASIIFDTIKEKELIPSICY